MPTQYLGELAALLSSFCFVIGPTMNTLASRVVRIGTLNSARLVITALLLLLLHRVLYGTFFPGNLQPENWLWLALSGLFGMVLGDGLLFTAFSQIGARLGMLILSLIPVISAVFAWFILGERLEPIQMAGILITIFGVGWVVLDRKGVNGVNSQAVHLKGIWIALASAFFFSFGSITAKMGMANSMPALSGHLVRTVFALAILSAGLAWQRKFFTSWAELKTAKGVLWTIFIGAVFGPLLGNWLVLFALQKTDVGIVNALMSLPPVLLLPVGKYFFNEDFGIHAVIGSLLAVVGVAILFLN